MDSREIQVYTQAMQGSQTKANDKGLGITCRVTTSGMPHMHF